MDEWNTDIDEKIIRPLTRKAIDRYAEEFIKEKSPKKEIEIDGYTIRMIKNPIISNNFFLDVIFPEAREADYMLNLEVKTGDTWHVGIYYKMKNGKWMEENPKKKLTTYR